MMELTKESAKFSIALPADFPENYMWSFTVQALHSLPKL